MTSPISEGATTCKRNGKCLKWVCAQKRRASAGTQREEMWLAGCQVGQEGLTIPDLV